MGIRAAMIGLLGIVLLTGCSKDEPRPQTVFVPPPFPCSYAPNQYDGALDGTNRQEVAVKHSSPYDKMDVFLCKAGTQCEDLARIDWAATLGKVTIYEGARLQAKLGFDTYHISEALCQ